MLYFFWNSWKGNYSEQQKYCLQRDIHILFVSPRLVLRYQKTFHMWDLWMYPEESNHAASQYKLQSNEGNSSRHFQSLFPFSFVPISNMTTENLTMASCWKTELWIGFAIKLDIRAFDSTPAGMFSTSHLRLYSPERMLKCTTKDKTFFPATIWNIRQCDIRSWLPVYSGWVEKAEIWFSDHKQVRFLKNRDVWLRSEKNT